MTTIIGEYAVNYHKSDEARKWTFYAVPTQGANLSNRRGYVWADDEDLALQHIEKLLYAD